MAKYLAILEENPEILSLEKILRNLVHLRKIHKERSHLPCGCSDYLQSMNLEKFLTGPDGNLPRYSKLKVYRIIYHPG